MSEPPSPHDSGPSEADPADNDPTGVHELLSRLQPPADAPPELVERIQASLRDEQHSREHRRPQPPYALFAGRSGRPGRRRFVVLGAGVTGCALLVAGTTVLPQQLPALMTHLTRAPAHASASTASPRADPPAVRGARHIRASGTLYSMFGLREQAVELRGTGPTVTQVREVPGVSGGIGSAAGLTSCFAALDLPADALAWVDLAEYEGEPAVIIVTRQGGTDQVRVVSPDCREGNPGLRAGPIPL